MIIHKRTRLLILTFAGIIFLWMFMTPIQNYIESQGLPDLAWLVIGFAGTAVIIYLGVKIL